MKQLALLSMNSLEDFVCYDDLLVKPMASLNWKVDTVSWRALHNWNDYDAVIVRSTWDYQDDPELFLQVLNDIEQSSARLYNSLDIMKWNFDKRYLQDLKSNGIQIVPSTFVKQYSHKETCHAFDHYDCNEIVIKPCISANADHTYRLSKAKVLSMKDELSECFNHRPHIIQPFLKSIIKNGEYSIFYFNGQYSHAIVKTPKEGDFRVQEEHGGTLKSIIASTDVLKICSKIIGCLDETPLYIRLDLVDYQNEWLLMEIELIEPSLYFNLDDQSAMLFAKAFIQQHSKS